MKRSIITLFVIAFSLLMVNKVQAQQDPNFTLYNFNMNIINPAFAGNKDTPELNMVYRSQYLGIDDGPRTAALSYSRALGSNLGIGISVINDRVFVLNETDVALDISYRLQTSDNTNIYFGLKAGGGFVNIDLTKSNAPGNDPLFTQNQSFFNAHIGAGLNIQNEKFNISISTPNFLNGTRYIKQGNAPSAAVDKMHFYIGGSYNFTLSDNLLLTPRFMMRTVEGAPTSYDVGSSLEINEKITAGANYRVEEMVSIYGLINVIDNLKFGVAYDMVTTDVNLVNDNGSLEFILKYQFK